MPAENTTPSVSPIRVGQAVLIRTVTHYHVGVIVEINKDHFVLERVSWVADTGRFGEALANGTLAQVEQFPGLVAVSRGSWVDIAPWNHALPFDTARAQAGGNR